MLAARKQLAILVQSGSLFKQGPTAQGAGIQPFHVCAKPSSQVTQPKVIHPAISQAKGIRAAIFQPKVIPLEIFL
jgi:hypothetical protein